MYLPERNRDDAAPSPPPRGRLEISFEAHMRHVSRIIGFPLFWFAFTVSIRADEAALTPSFLNDVIPLLTKLGCNQGSCHGKAAGQNGFRLSLRGYAPEQDHVALTREFGARRLDPAAPQASLLLQKPLGAAKHEGGRLLTRDSREYRLLFDWIVAGAPGPKAGDPTLTSLHLSPAGQRLRVGDRLSLKVDGEFSDGTRRDVTWLTRFDSNDTAVVDVTPAGVARAVRSGETAVRASFQTEVAVTILSVPHERAIPAEHFSQRNNALDDYVCSKLAELCIEPSDLCDDGAFVRRAFLDTIGLLPTPDEVCAYLADRGKEKRSRLIDALLARPEYSDFWTLQLCDLLQNRKERDHDVRGAKGVRTFHEWVRRQVAANRPWDAIVRDVLTATGTTRDHPEIGYFIVTVGEEREAHRSEVVASAAQAFLGTRIGCAKCHNHPLERYTQDDYYHFSAYFSRIRFDRKDAKDGPTRLSISHNDPSQNKNPIGVTQPRTGRFLSPRPLDRSNLPVAANEDPRLGLAAWITDAKNEAFSGAMINRLWKHFFGTGLVEPVDDLRATNPPSNPALWAYLKQEFVQHHFDMKHVMRLILNSRTYQLDSATKPGNVADTRFYSHYYPRRLPAEVMADAVAAATGVPDSYPGYPLGMRAVQLPDPGVKSSFLAIFGRSERVTACACERNDDVAMVHLLHLLNGDAIRGKIRAADGRLANMQRQKKKEHEIAEELFLSTVSRMPNAAERALVERWLQDGDRQKTWEDLFWALLNSKDFSFNH